jgi:crossover junction endodeoxyribonuclease RuvC
MSIYIGIDPGKSGGIAADLSQYYGADSCGSGRLVLKLQDTTEAEVTEWLRRLPKADGHQYAVIEKVSSSPQMGVVSAFSFGQSYGFLRGCLASLEIAYVPVTPQKWQKAMGCMSGGDKNKTKAKAQQLYPGERITHATADALLLATYCRQNHSQLF